METNDKGSVFFPAIEDNFQRLNDHDHDGTDSALLPPSSFAKFTSTILAAQWSSDGGGNYSKVVTVPVGISGAATYNDIKYYDIFCQDLATGDRLLLTIEKETAYTFTVRINDNTLDVLIYYV